MNFKHKINLFFFLLLTLFTRVEAQNLMVANPSDVHDSKAVFINPAILPFQPARFLIGMKVFHVGFLEDNKLGFKNSYFSATTPFLLNKPIVLSVSGQHFGLPLYKQSDINFQAAFLFKHRYVIGLKYNLLNKSYDKANFNVVDEFDPVLSNNTSKISHSFGIGALISILPNLKLGCSLNHINQPDISLAGDGIKLPVQYNFGFVYDYQYWSVAINMNIFQDAPQFNYMLQYKFLEKGSLSAGYEFNSAKLEGQLHVTNKVYLNYSYEYPLFEFNEISSGSHQISMIYAFNQKPLSISKGKRKSIFNGDLAVKISTNNLQIVEKKIKKTVDPDVNENNISKLSSIEMAIVDSSRTDDYFCDQNHDYAIYTDVTESNMYLTDKYKNYLKSINNYNNKRIALYHKNSSKKNINDIKNLLTSNNINVKRQEISNYNFNKLRTDNYPPKIVLFIPDNLYFKLNNPDNFVKYWKIEITEIDGNVVKKLGGSGNIPAKIHWDWKKTDSVLKPGVYYYTLYWTDYYDNFHRSESDKITVRKINRQLSIEIKSEAKQKAEFVKNCN